MHYERKIWIFNGYGFDQTTLIVDITLLNRRVIWQL
jgi:hypothetical protein